MKRNQRKRRRDETHESGDDANSSTKLLKTCEDPMVANKPASSEKSNFDQPNDLKMKDKGDDAPPAKDDPPVQQADDANMDDKEDDADEEDPEEGPEEDPEEYEELEDEAPQDDLSNEVVKQLLLFFSAYWFKDLRVALFRPLTLFITGNLL